MKSLALLLLRVTTGSLLAGHGGQKLFGWFEGPGLKNTQQWVESMNMRPGKTWGTAAGVSEFGGGALMTLGLFNPLGPIMAIGAMSMATAKAHWGKPIWVTKGGAELPVTNIAVASALMLAGPGKISLDQLFGTRLSRWVAVPGLALTGIAVYTGVKGELPLPAEARAQVEAKARELFERIGMMTPTTRTTPLAAETTGTTTPATATTTTTTTTTATTRNTPRTPSRPATTSTASTTGTPSTSPTSTMERIEDEHPQVAGTL